MVSLIAGFVFLSNLPNKLEDADAIASYGVPAADAKVFSDVIPVALAKGLPRTGKSSVCKFLPAKTNAPLEGVMKAMGATNREFRAILPGVEKELGPGANDLSYYLAIGTTLAIQGQTGKEISETAGDRIQQQIGFSLNAAGWEALPAAQKSTIANVTKALLFIEFVVMAGEDEDAKKKMSDLFMSNVFGSDSSIRLKGDWLETVRTTPAPSNALKVGGLITIPTLAGYTKADFGGSPGITKAYEDYPSTTNVNFVLLPFNDSPFSDFKSAWAAALPAGNIGQITSIPFKRYIGNGARATMGYGFAKNAKGEAINILVYNIENGSGSQALAGYYTHASYVNRIVTDMELVLASMRIPGASAAPLATRAELAGTWTTHGASQMGYFSTSSGNLVGAAVVDRNVEYTFRTDGTFSYEYTGVTGDLGNLKAGEDKQSGSYELKGDRIILKPKGKTARELSFRGVMQTSAKDRVLLLGQAGRNMEGELYYMEKFVRKQ